MHVISNAKANIHEPHIDFILNTDVSESQLGTKHGENPAGRVWADIDKGHHKNLSNLNIKQILGRV